MSSKMGRIETLLKRKQIVKKLVLTYVVALLVLGLLIFVPDADAAQNDRRDHRPAATISHAVPGRFHTVGYKVKTLPAGHRRIAVGGAYYYYHGGVFYRPQGSTYIVINAPIGARVNALPTGYLSFSIGSRRYFYVNATYYFFEPDKQEYVVVEEPEGADEAMNLAQPAGQLFVYPNNGQSEEQIRQDRYECYVWASGQTGFDPALPNQPAEYQSDYDRALSACLSGRGYTVR